MNDSIIMITGGTGSWGQELTRQLLKFDPEKIIIFSRGENNQVKMEREFNDSRLKFVIGDIRDREALKNVMGGVDYVFHAAAMKHVPICENQISEVVKTNIEGTQNVIDASIMSGVKRFIFISTDKTVDPANVYGMTKAIGERMTIQANAKTKFTDFIVTRTGNVLGTSGSVVPLFIEKIIKENRITVTDKRMVRFFLTLSHAIGTLFYAFEYGRGGEIFVKDISAFYVSDLAEIIVERYGNEDTQIEYTGLRPGEKIDEALISESEIERTYRDGDYYIILPQIKTGRFYDMGEPLQKPLIASDVISTKDELKKMI